MKKIGRIMVVDDEENIREVLSNYLETLGYEVLTASDGADALTKFEVGAFDLIISDLLMPNIDGLELLRKVREKDRDVVFLMIKKGAYDYITKPFHMEDVKIRIERSFEKKNLRDRLSTIQGFVWALLFSIPVWLILGIILAKLLK
jgi:two-component system response regulator PilR (NtrC family)